VYAPSATYTLRSHVFLAVWDIFRVLCGQDGQISQDKTEKLTAWALLTFLGRHTLSSKHSRWQPNHFNHTVDIPPDTVIFSEPADFMQHKILAILPVISLELNRTLALVFPSLMASDNLKALPVCSVVGKIKLHRALGFIPRRQQIGLMPYHKRTVA
jgi:hypothetical protein